MTNPFAIIGLSPRGAIENSLGSAGGSPAQPQVPFAQPLVVSPGRGDTKKRHASARISNQRNRVPVR